MTIKALDWRITLGLSIVSPLFNWAWYLLVTHNALQSLKLAASSVISIAAVHAVHHYKAKRIEEDAGIDSPS